MISSPKFADLGEDYFSRVDTQKLKNSHLIHVNKDLQANLKLNLTEEELLAICSGEKKLGEVDPISSVYAGHQFGYFVPQLGDGRSCLIGELNGYELSLKGAGTTPFSRGADGRAVLRSSIREYLCSIAMEGLNIPTTKCLAIVASDTDVYREHIESGSIVTRVSESHIRFGHFEYFASKGQNENIKKLADFVINHYYPKLKGKNCYLDLFKTVVQTTAVMIARWQAQGFAHGVMNTDNMSILGETFDYGPFGFLDRFQPNYICNHSDNEGRYAFDRQPSIAFWNLSVLAHAMSPLVEQDALNEGLQSFNQVFNEDYLDLLSAKLGFVGRPKDDSILVGTLDMMAKNHLDYSYFFRQLSDVSDEKVARKLKDLCINPAGFDQWLSDYTSSLKVSGTDKQRRVRMNTLNPKYILRNHLAQKAIEQAEKGDYSEVQKLHTILQNPFDEQDENSAYAKLPPSWSQDLEISCSS